MIYKNNNITIYVENKEVDIFSQDRLNLRFNNQFVDLTKIQTITSEYTFSFLLPLSDNNIRIFDYANILSKRGKYNKRYRCQVNVNSLVIFDGELLLNSVSKDGFACSLYINKLNTVESIFGDTKLNEISDFYYKYEQDKTINTINGIKNLEYPFPCMFPLVSYGMFNKFPENDGTYASKYVIDDKNRIYNEDFYPSLNLLTVVEKCFKHKGYELQGDIFDDELIRHIYMSTTLSDKQDPLYNLGDPNIGKVEFSYKYTNRGTMMDGGREYINSAKNVTADKKRSILQNKYKRAAGEYNWTANNVYDIFSAGKPFFTFTDDQGNDIEEPINLNTNMFRENAIIIPADGYYKIKMRNKLMLMSDNELHIYYYTYSNEKGEEQTACTTEVSFNNFMSEIQLIRNSEDSQDVQNIIPDTIENITTTQVLNGRLETRYDTDREKLYPAYPHEAPSKYSVTNPSNEFIAGFAPQNAQTLVYDPWVNENFIAGFTAAPSLHNSVIKNGTSWKSDCTKENKSKANVAGYWGIKIKNKPPEGGETPRPGGNRRSRYHTERVAELTDHNKDILPNAIGPGAITRRWVGGTGVREEVVSNIECIVFLKKNDILQLKLLERQFINKADEDNTEGVRPHDRDSDQFTDAWEKLEGYISVEAFSPDDISLNNKYFDWNNPSRFDKELNLANFLRDDERMSDFISNFIKEFNLSFSQTSNVITLNKQKLNDITDTFVDLTDRVTDREISSEAVEFPSSLAVEYTINDRERGFYLSASQNATDEQLMGNDWKNYGDKGYDIIKITDDEQNKEQRTKLKTSYNWYDTWKVEQNGQNIDVRLPVIALDEWMIDHYKDKEMMRKRGYNLPRRYWFAGDITNAEIDLCGNKKRKVFVREVRNDYDGVELSYKETENSLLTTYFNIYQDVDTNYINFDCYLRTDEWLLLRNGARIKIDDDIYMVTKIQGFDPSGRNKTNIKAIKS